MGGPIKLESEIVNVDKEIREMTHLVAYKKIRSIVYYFDNYGKIKPPIELIRYFKKCSVINYVRHQKYNRYHRGHLCLEF